MNITTWRQARLQLVRDSLCVIGARMGFLGVNQINDLEDRAFEDGWRIRCMASKGVGNRIKHIVTVIITSDLGDVYNFTFDVLGDNQTKNCTFACMVQLEEQTTEEFSDLCFLPEIFADFVATLLEKHYVTLRDGVPSYENGNKRTVLVGGV